MKNNLSPAESWVSYVDAGIIEAIERGGASALGLKSARFAATTGGAGEWAAFLRGMASGRLARDRDAHDYAWSIAEQRATEYGAARADAKFRRPSRVNNWFQFTQLFRFIMRNRRLTILGLKAATLSNLATSDAIWVFINWMTDVTDVQPGECITEVAWFFTGQAKGGGADRWKEIVGIYPKLKECFDKRKKT